MRSLDSDERLFRRVAKFVKASGRSPRRPQETRPNLREVRRNVSVSSAREHVRPIANQGVKIFIVRPVPGTASKTVAIVAAGFSRCHAVYKKWGHLVVRFMI